jgi:hypothetical protein
MAPNRLAARLLSGHRSGDRAPRRGQSCSVATTQVRSDLAETDATTAGIEDAHIRIGGRVRLAAPSPLLELANDTGTVVRRDIWDGYYIVRLDAPGILRHGEGSTERVTEVAEAADNLEAIG